MILSGMSRRLVPFSTQVAADLLDIVAPRDCVSCAAPGRTLCAQCLAVLGSSRPVLDHRRIGRAAVAGGWLEGVLGATVRGYKAGVGRGLARPLSQILAAAVEHLLLHQTVVPAQEPGWGTCRLVAIPPSLRARWTRGDDVLGRVVDLAVATLRRRGVQVERARWLEPARLVRDQRGLGARSRRLNVEGSLRVRPGTRSCAAGPDGPVIIVDDVLTTGATLREAIRALAEADISRADPNGRILGAAVIAATRDRLGGRTSLLVDGRVG